MASSRTMRSSRLASPMDTTTRDSSSVRREVQKPREKQTTLGSWVEPPLRTPAPSFEDYKGLERQGVLEHMAPLGSFPSHKVKQRLKTLNGPRRSSTLKNGSNAMTEEEAATPEPTVPPASRRSEPRKSESRIPSSRDKDEDRDYTPSTVSRPSSAKGPTAHTTLSTLNSRSSAREQRLKGIVESAVKRAEELNNPYLGKAVQELFNRSLHDRTIADLLDAVLSQTPTAEQTADFQAMVKLTRKEIRDAEKQALRQLSHAASPTDKSPLKSSSKGSCGSATRRGVTTEEFSDAPGSNANRDTNHSISKHRARRMETNGTPSKPERPSKRMKRSYSDASSTSSLSSLTSDTFQRSPRPASKPKYSSVNNGPPPAPPPEYYTAMAAMGGPKLHSFPLNNRSKPVKKAPVTSAAASTDVPAEEIAAKRRQLQKKFEYTVNDSAVRDSPAVSLPQQRRKSHQIGSPLPLRTQQTRLRNGGLRHELHEDRGSPWSSYHGELLAPPTVDGQMITRGGTPNQLGRPPKHVKKAARIKMSPQKAKPTTAGQPRPGGDGDADGLSDNASELDNDDICSACGGEGEVLCCDGCTRSFHYICLDPPKHAAPEGEWLCRHCIATKLKPQGLDLEISIDGVTDGVLEPIFKKLQGKNPHCFALPKTIRETFEGVKTSTSGEYEEVLPAKPKTRANLDMQMELGKAKDVIKDSVALCFACGASSAGGCEIIGCSFCPLHWHLDCLDPPLATSPFRLNPLKPDGHQRKIVWQCPNHADSEMQTLTEPISSRRGTVRNAGGKVRKVRRPKHAIIKDVGLRRGYVNNGIIEILNDPSDEENELETETGTVPRLREMGIKLDFFDRVKSITQGTSKSVLERDAKKLQIAAAAKERKREAAKEAAKADMEVQEALRRRSFAEQHVVMALTQMQSPGLPPAVGISPVENLIGALISEAPGEVAELFAQAEVPTDAQADFLRLAIARMQEILARKQS